MIFVWLSAAFLLALGAALVLTPLVARSAGALKLVDSPDGGRRLHDRPVPRLGGVAVFLGAALAGIVVLIAAQGIFFPTGLHSGDMRFLAGVSLGAALLFFVGLIDDVRGLSAGTKFVTQVAAALIAFSAGAHFDSVTLGYGEGVATGVLAFPLVLLWIVGATNAFNFVDGLNGLASGIGAVAALTTVAVAAKLGNLAILIPAVALAGALLGFLRYNFPRASIFLGDSGSLSVGFLVAVFLLRASTTKAGSVLAVVPLLGLSVPLLDGTLAILRRWLRHVPLAGADARHIHHRLLALGLTPARTVHLLWMLAGVMAGFGLLIALTAPFVAASIAIFGLLCVCVLLIYGTNLLSYHELIVAGEVLLSAPSRARRVISDQILAVDLASLIQSAKSVDEISGILGNSSGQFGFLAMDLSADGFDPEPGGGRIMAQNWGWRLDYPIRQNESDLMYGVLSIWCSQEHSARPYGAERAARVLGPALLAWFEAGIAETAEGPRAGTSLKKTPSRYSPSLRLFR